MNNFRWFYRFSRVGFFVSSLFITVVLFQNATSSTDQERGLIDIHQDPNDVAVNGFEIVADPTFTAGFKVTEACPETRWQGVCIGMQDYFLSNPRPSNWNSVLPVWNLRQHSSAGNLPSAGRISEGGGVTWVNRFKQFTVFPNGRFRMSTNGYEEYDGKYPTAAESYGWPHFLLSQSVSGGSYARNPGTVDTFDSLMLNFEFQLLRADLNRTKGYDPSKSGAIFPMYFQVQNLNRAKGREGGYGNMIWLGLGLYNDRNPYPGDGDGDGHYITEQRTGKLIYMMPYSKFASHETTHGFIRVRFSGDILPYVKRAVQIGYSEGVFKSNDISDYQVSGMNLGFEVTRALNHTAVELQGLSLRAQGKRFPRSFEFNIDGESHGWRPVNMVPFKSPAPSGGVFRFRTGSGNSQLISPKLNIDGNFVKKVQVRVARDAEFDAHLTMYFATEGGKFVKAQSTAKIVPGDGGWRTIVFDMSDVPSWTGTITGIRFDPTPKGTANGIFGFDSIRFMQ